MEGGARSLISFESTKQQAILMLSFEHYSLKSLDKILQEGPSLSTVPHLSTYNYSHTMHVTKSPRLSSSVFVYCKQSKTGQWRMPAKYTKDRRIYLQEAVHFHPA